MTTLEAVQGDITRETTDAIVNAANTSLAPGGGVCGAIHHAAGPDLARACHALSGCPTGSAKITPGYNLVARYVIHAVGPVWQGGTANEAELLGSCYRAVLAIAGDYHLRSLAFPCISTGIYGYPIAEAAEIAVRAVKAELAHLPEIDLVRFVCFSDSDLQAYRSLVEQE